MPRPSPADATSPSAPSPDASEAPTPAVEARPGAPRGAAPGGASPKPEKAKPEKAKRLRPGSLKSVKAHVWKAILTTEGILGDPEVDPATRLRAVHALVQASQAYVRLVEATEMAEVVSELERERDRDRDRGPAAGLSASELERGLDELDGPPNQTAALPNGNPNGNPNGSPSGKAIGKRK